ncbi:hypothetical protein FHX74_000568 [Friedmanniella endophytica]|uniref:Aminoglycoside phosphotransferase domain-containing protein n=1 Tax=Microlunatus kandeliicorticis TaxID=1759536 RepID=A0A7W3P4J6_9ACTN|nr:phosphotransferase [Microlunatus kandeliicorticis]MBA8792974.1 hypothetical protein [Microlunatus kandeliicorticis]
MTAAPPASVAHAAAALGCGAVRWTSPGTGLSAAERHVVVLDDGRSVFVKGATDPATERWLRTEAATLEVVGPGLGPAVLGWLDGVDDHGVPFHDHPVLVTEDLSAGYWPAGSCVTRWRPGDVGAVLAGLDRLAELGVPDGLAPVADWPDPHWPALVSDDRLVAGGLVDPDWLHRHGAALARSDVEAVWRPEVVVHGDVRSDNLCLTPDGVRFVDWSLSGLGCRDHDRVRLLPTLHLEGGPAPDTQGRVPPPLIAPLTGDTVARAVGPDPMPDWLRDVFLRLARIDLAWLAAALGLEPPTPR